MTLYHTRQFTDPAEKPRQARGLLQFLADSGSQPPAGGQRAAPSRVQLYAERRNELFRGILGTSWITWRRRRWR